VQRLIAVLSAAGVLSCATGCDEKQAGHFGDLKVVGMVQAVWSDKPAPSASGPARIVRNVTLLSPRHGFLVTAAEQGVGFQRHGLGRIQETHDGGLTWRTVWSRGETELSEIAFSDKRHGTVAGFREVGGTLKPLLLRTGDGGRRWQVIRPTLPWTSKEEWPYFQFQFPQPAIGYAVGDPDSGIGLPRERWLLKTSDGGRSWHKLQSPGGAYATGMDWLDLMHGYVTDSRLLYATSDGGESWRPVAGTRAEGYQLTAIDFLDRQTALLIGGNPNYFETPPGLVVRRTDDGGATWRTIFIDSRRGAVGADPFVRLALVDRRHAWAATGGCKNGQNSPCGGEIWTTADGGTIWRRTGQSAVHVTSSGPETALAVEDGCECGVLWRTRNGGRSWSPLFGPRGVGLHQVALAGRRVRLDTDAGWFESQDAGATWRRSPRFDLDPDRSPPGFVAREWYDGLQISRDENRSWKTISTPVDLLRAWAFADEKHIYVASEETKGGPGSTYASSDEGKSWRRLRAPFLPITISATPALVALNEGRLDPPRVAFSENGGTTWRVVRLPQQHSCYATVGGGRTAWLWCEGDLERSTKTSFFRSTDSGRTWTRLLVGDMLVHDVALQGDELWAIASPRGQSTNSLWRSRNGGRTWDQVWPSLPVGR
jgi:photosystem II stability/assembly factor-like uncharacterized protein